VDYDHGSGLVSALLTTQAAFSAQYEFVGIDWGLE
jgi:hypothetical protein